MSILLSSIIALSTVFSFAASENLNEYTTPAGKGCSTESGFIQSGGRDNWERATCVRLSSVDDYIAPPNTACSAKNGFIQSGDRDNWELARCVRISSVDTYTTPPNTPCSTENGFIQTGDRDNWGLARCMRLSEDKTGIRYKLKTLLELEDMIFSCDESIQYRNSLREFYLANGETLQDAQKTKIRTIMTNMASKFKAECDAQNTTKIQLNSTNDNIQ